MGILRLLVCAAAAVAVSGSRLIRRRVDVNRPDIKNIFTVPAIEQQGCAPGAAFQMATLGERNDPTMLFAPVDPGLPAHTNLLKWTSAQKAQWWDDAAVFFFERFGVDFRGIPMNEEMGIREIDGWRLEPYRYDFNLRVVLDSERGHHDCPRYFGDEGIRLIPMKDGLMYHGTYGGDEGLPVVSDDIVAFAALVVDLSGDGNWERMPYFSLVPFRNQDNQFTVSWCIISERYGMGRMDGKLSMTMDHKTMEPHGHYRMLTTFPARFELDNVPSSIWLP